MPSNNTENILSTPFTEGTGNPIPATRISYDNTNSGLTADDVQGAIDEVAGAIDNMPATDIAYNNTNSGLTATNVQGAIDEIATQETEKKTPTFSINPARYQCSKTSKLCMINAYWSSPTTGNITITLPDDIKPDTSDYVEAIAWDSASAIVRCAINSEGVITIPVDSSKNYSLMAIWNSI